LPSQDRVEDAKLRLHAGCKNLNDATSAADTKE
jgi:hypothetical protein